MGRKKKYNTEEELLNAKRAAAMRYYERHKEVRKKAALERYYRKKMEKQNAENNIM